MRNNSSCLSNASFNKTDDPTCEAADGDETTVYLVFFYLDLILIIISLFHLSLGLFSIHISPKKRNQNIILAALTVMEMVGVVGGTLDTIFERPLHDGSVDPIVIVPLTRAVRSISSFGVVFIMYILTVDRIVMASSPLKYKHRVTRRRTIRQVLFFFLLAIVLGILKSVISSDEVAQGLTIMLLMIGIGYLVVTIGGYTFIIMEINKSRKRFRSASGHLRPRLKFKRQFLVPTVIMLTFVGLYCVPYLLFNYIYR